MFTGVFWSQYSFQWPTIIAASLRTPTPAPPAPFPLPLAPQFNWCVCSSSSPLNPLYSSWSHCLKPRPHMQLSHAFPPLFQVWLKYHFAMEWILKCPNSCGACIPSGMVSGGGVFRGNQITRWGSQWMGSVPLETLKRWPVFAVWGHSQTQALPASWSWTSKPPEVRYKGDTDICCLSGPPPRLWCFVWWPARAEAHFIWEILLCSSTCCFLST